MLIIIKKSIQIHLKQYFLMQTLQGIHFIYFCFGFQFFLALLTKAIEDIVFRFIIEYNSFMDFGPHVVHLFLCKDF